MFLKAINPLASKLSIINLVDITSKRVSSIVLHVLDNKLVLFLTKFILKLHYVHPQVLGTTTFPKITIFPSLQEAIILLRHLETQSNRL